MVLDPQIITRQSEEASLTRRNPRTLSSLPEILSSLSALQSEEAEYSNSLTDLLNSKDPILVSLNRLTSLITSVNDLQHEATLLRNKVSNTAKTAERIGGRVRSLDEEMKRIWEAGDHVSQVMELKSSLTDLQSSISVQDWESATRHCAKAMTLPLGVISGQFAESAVPTSDSHLPPAQTLQISREELLVIFRHKFEEASRSRDSTATSRFFKLFPAIGWEEEGLDIYATFVVDLVRARAPANVKTSSPVYYIIALTALFESIAMIVDQHQPIVEKHYGPGKMQTVIQRLLQECDQVTKDIVQGWEEERSMKRKLIDITNNLPISTFPPASRRPPPSIGPEEVTTDPREIDKVLSEIAGMVGRWHLFRKFLRESLGTFDDPKSLGSEVVPSLIMVQTAYIDSTQSFKLFEWLINTYYVPLELWYIRTSIDKAHRLSSTDQSQYPVITTTPDDAFYILKVVISRLLSTGSPNAVERIFEQLREVMERDYIGVIKKKLDDIYRSTGVSGSTTRSERADKENRTVFITLLNDLDTSASHLERLMRDLSMSQIVNQSFIDEQQPLVRDRLASFSILVAKLSSTLRIGVEQMFNQLMRPKLRTLISDVYKDISYVLDDDSYSAADHQDAVRKRFVMAWEYLLDGYRELFTEGSYRLFFGLALDMILRPWEKFIMSLRFTELGAIRFDRDLRSVITYLASQTALGDGREKFVRLQQISTILNLDSEENIDEFYNSSGITWKLNLTEARAITGLKL